MRVPGGGASCLGVERPVTGALPAPTSRLFGRAAGAHYPLAVGAGAAGVGTRHQPHCACPCAQWGRHEGARGGRLLPGCGASGDGRSPTPDLSFVRPCGRDPLPTGRGCGVQAGGPGCPWLVLWLMSKIPQRTWDDCRSTSERKSRTHSYHELVDLLIELALERENDSHMEKFLKKHLGRGGTPTPERGEGKQPKNPTNANQGGGKGRGNLRAMNEVKPDAGTPPLFYCKPVNDKGGPCHAPDCDQRSSCMLQMKRQQHTKNGKPVTDQDHFRCTI